MISLHEGQRRTPVLGSALVNFIPFISTQRTTTPVASPWSIRNANAYFNALRALMFFLIDLGIMLNTSHWEPIAIVPSINPATKSIDSPAPAERWLITLKKDRTVVIIHNQKIQSLVTGSSRSLRMKFLLLEDMGKEYSIAQEWLCKESSLGQTLEYVVDISQIRIDNLLISRYQ